MKLLILCIAIACTLLTGGTENRFTEQAKLSAAEADSLTRPELEEVYLPILVFEYLEWGLGR